MCSEEPEGRESPTTGSTLVGRNNLAFGLLARPTLVVSYLKSSRLCSGILKVKGLSLFLEFRNGSENPTPLKDCWRAFKVHMRKGLGHGSDMLGDQGL